jgi:hypothetical protein
VRITHPEYQEWHYHLAKADKDVHDVFKMIIAGFSKKMDFSFIHCLYGIPLSSPITWSQ